MCFGGKAVYWKMKITNQDFFCCETLTIGLVNKMTSQKISSSHFFGNTAFLRRTIEKWAFLIIFHNLLVDNSEKKIEN